MHSGDAPNACFSTKYADINDLSTVLEMYIEALHSMPEHYQHIDRNTCLETVTNAWLSMPTILLKNKDKIVGFCGLLLSSAPHNKIPYISEYMFFVRPEYRSMQAIKALSESAQNVATTFNLKLVLSYIFNGKTSGKFLNRLGYETSGLIVTFGGKNG